MDRRKRRLGLFWAAVVVPGVLLAALTFRFLRQDEELSRQRAENARRSAAEQAGRELTARLDAIQLQEINRRLGIAAKNDASSDSAIVFAVPWSDEGMTLPWLTENKLSYPSALFTASMDEGEMLEFRQMNAAAAARSYSRALSEAQQPQEICDARLSLGRVLLKSQKAKEALQIYGDMLTACRHVFDDAGMPLSLYAAERLVESKLNVAAATDYLAREVQEMRFRPLPQLSMIRMLLQKIPPESANQALALTAAQMKDIEQIMTLAKEFHTLRAVAGNDWVAYGDEPWLLRWRQASAPMPPLLFAVSSRKAAPPSTRLISNKTAQSYSLGAGFSHIEIELESQPALTASTAAALIPIGVGFILVFTMLGGYFLLRDLNRDLRTAEMRSQFVASVSHELKTPLTAIRLFAETLSMGRTPDERTRSEYLETLMNESERLARLVDNVLDFSKIDQGKKIYRMRSISLPAVTHSATRAMQYPLAQQGFTLHVTVDDNLPEVNGDPDALEQAILNLLSNAMKYSGDAREIELSCGSDKAEAVLAVRDRGIGIAPSDQSRIFEKFYRVQSSDTHLIAGTGLGLTLVKHIAGAHGGSIDVKSALGEGSTFTIRIPLRAADMEQRVRKITPEVHA